MLQDTNLLVQMAQIPPTFKGTPQDLAVLMVQRMRIVSPTGTNFFFVGDVEPTSNVGPWLKNGTQWWVYSEAFKRYVPLDISASEKTWYFIQATTPSSSVPPLWLRTTKDPTDADPSVGDPLGWYVFDGTNWSPFLGIVESGVTANRPSAPVEYQQYYDTEITALIWWERASWRTVSGVPGDIKFVAFETLDDAKEANPGWDLFGASNQSFRGRWISQATKDSPGSGGSTDLNTDVGVAHRAAFETYGTDTPVTVSAGTLPAPPPTIALWCLVKL